MGFGAQHAQPVVVVRTGRYGAEQLVLLGRRRIDEVAVRMRRRARRLRGGGLTAMILDFRSNSDPEVQDHRPGLGRAYASGVKSSGGSPRPKKCSIACTERRAAWP